MTTHATEPRPPLLEPVRPLDPDDVRRMASALSPRPAGMGRPITDRDAWQRLGRTGTFQRTLAEAAERLDEAIPELTEDIYLDHVRTGGEEVYNAYNRTTRYRLTRMVLAECVEDRGRFLPAIHASIRAICAEPTWVHAFHDRQLRNWRGETIEIDLSAGTVGCRLATADHFLGDRLDGGTRAAIRTEISRRILAPFNAMLAGARIFLNQAEPFTWLELTHNWNAVCLANVVGTALAIVEPPEERARHVAASARYIRNYLSGFAADGCCSEGMGYWNFGFSHFLMLGETLWQATDGAIDLLDDEHVRSIARYGARMEIMPGAYPAFADCEPDVSPIPDVMRIVSRRFGLGLMHWEQREPEASSLPFVAALAFPEAEGRAAARAAAREEIRLRSWFADAGVFVGRPRTSGAHALGMACKGGCNAEHHNHNDLGSFVVALEGKLLLTDPGSELYTARTFGPDRYDSKVLSSYGHPVPRVAGRLQRTGADARAPVLRKRFSAEQDLIVYDLRPAYDVPALAKLHRTFVFSRRGAGCVKVTDAVTFREPQPFGAALITFGRWRQAGPGRLVVLDGADALCVDLRVTGGEVTIRAEIIEEDVRADTRPTRIGIDLDGPVVEAVLELVITPARAHDPRPASAPSPAERVAHPLGTDARHGLLDVCGPSRARMALPGSTAVSAARGGDRGPRNGPAGDAVGGSDANGPAALAPPAGCGRQGRMGAQSRRHRLRQAPRLPRPRRCG